MQTSLQLVRPTAALGGLITLTSRAWMFPEFGGFVGVMVLIYGPGRTPEWLWNSVPTAFGVEPAGDDAQVSMTLTHRPEQDVLAAARWLAIKQFPCPTRDAWSAIKSWLDAAQSPTNGFDLVQHTAREVGRPLLSVARI